MKPELQSEAATGSKEAIEDKTTTVPLNHPLLNKWLTAEIINNLPDETAQAVADLIETAVKSHKPAVDAIYYVESWSTGGLVSFNRGWLLEPSLNVEGVVKDVSEKKPEQPGY